MRILLNKGANKFIKLKERIFYYEKSIICFVGVKFSH